ncbi:hypothetical protein ACU686_17930 [Yinghuangia aomiensis]
MPDAMEVAHYALTFDVTDFDGAGTPLSDGAFFHPVEDPAHGPISVEASIVEKITGEPYNETLRGPGGGERRDLRPRGRHVQHPGGRLPGAARHRDRDRVRRRA